MEFTIKDGVLEKCTGTRGGTVAAVPDGVTAIGKGVFDGRKTLQSVTLPDSVTSIGNAAFRGCPRLARLHIPDSVKSIGEEAFCGCESLTSLTLPEGLTYIGAAAFKGCKGLTSVTLPEMLEKVRSDAFFGCSGLTSVRIPERVACLEWYAFGNCINLETVILPETVNRVSYTAFAYTRWLEKHTEPFFMLGRRLLRYNGTEREVVIPDGVTGIEMDAFSCCDHITSVHIPDSVTSIGRDAFGQCTGLGRVVLPDNVTEIGTDAFYDVKELVFRGVRFRGDLCFQPEMLVNMIRERDFSVRMEQEIKYDVIWQMYLQAPEEEAVFAYVRKNFMNMFRYAVQHGMTDVAETVCRQGQLLTKRNIDKFIDQAIAQGHTEIQILLMNHKNEKFGFGPKKFSL